MTAYEPVLRLQTELVAARRAGDLGNDVLLVLEHAPVFTLGRRGGRENLTVSAAALDRRGIEVLQAERGGNITYHGPGQVVAYPIFDLAARRLGVDAFVTGLEEVMLRTARQWGVTAGRDARNRGVWVAARKLGSVGIAVRRGVSFHGLALNAVVDLEPFGWINPCGLKGVQVTSLAREAGRPVTTAAVRGALKTHFEAVFDLSLTAVDPEALPVIGAAQGLKLS